MGRRSARCYRYDDGAGGTWVPSAPLPVAMPIPTPHLVPSGLDPMSATAKKTRCTAGVHLYMHRRLNFHPPRSASCRGVLTLRPRRATRQAVLSRSRPQQMDLRDLLPVDPATGSRVNALRYNGPSNTLIVSVGQAARSAPQRLYVRRAQESSYREILPGLNGRYFVECVVSDGAPWAFALERHSSNRNLFAVRAVHLPDAMSHEMPSVRDRGETQGRHITVMRIVGTSPDASVLYAVACYNVGSYSARDALVENKLIQVAVATGEVTAISVMPTPFA